MATRTCWTPCLRWDRKPWIFPSRQRWSTGREIQGVLSGTWWRRLALDIDDGTDSRYKAKGATTVDLSGSKDNAEMINVSKDDALAYPRVAHASYPSTVNARMENTVRPFVEACTDANNTIMAVFNAKLGLPEGTLANLHARDEPSVSEARVIKVPATPGSTKIAVGAHTDFGSLVSTNVRLPSLSIYALPVFPRQPFGRTAGPAARAG